jgi:pimeloyl-ACP methyl ester carboxylesterase
MPTIDNNGTRIYYETHGEGPAILLSHGFSATSQMWKPQLRALSQDHTLITWDFRGHGQSDAPEDLGCYSEALTTGDMAALLDATGFETAVIGGLSLGGYMSLAFYADYPERVNGLLIIDTGPGFKNDAAREDWNRYAESAALIIEEAGGDPSASPEVTQSVHRNFRGVANAGRTMLKQYNDRVIHSLPDISVPTIVVVGADDEGFITSTDYMVSKIPGARKLVIANAGHASNMDQPEVFNRGILAFLADHGL